MIIGMFIGLIGISIIVYISQKLAYKFYNSNIDKWWKIFMSSWAILTLLTVIILLSVK